MKAIHADPKEVRRIFGDKFIIPDFQRPYSWEIEQCDKFWEDFIDFYNLKASKDEKYFLGNIVIHPVDNEDGFAVVDGQQRLTTLLLFIKALHQKAGVVKALEECLKTKNPLTSDLENQLRVDSRVIEKDKEHLYDIVFNDGGSTPDNSRLKINYKYFTDKLAQWWIAENNRTDKLNELILTLLDQVVVLPIHCGSQDDALTIFETINNRGMSLTDADIFKAKLHHAAGNKKDELVDQWKELANHEWLFRGYMHILRSEEKDTSKEIALRSYFTKQNRLTDWEKVMKSLKLLNEVTYEWEASDDVESLWTILKTYPNYYWYFPLYVYLHKHGEMTEEGFSVKPQFVDGLKELIEETVRYFYVKGVVYNSVNAVRDTVFKVCSAIQNNQNYIEEYKKSIGEDCVEFKRRIENNQFGKYLRGLVLLCSYLNKEQNPKDFKNAIKGNYHIEHILPKKWNNYDGWSYDSWTSHINTLGNLIPLEYNLNISAKNEFFDKKKEYYNDSKIKDALELADISEWSIEACIHNNRIKMERLFNFIDGLAN